jgi:hypothetical protein
VKPVGLNEPTNVPTPAIVWLIVEEAVARGVLAAAAAVGAAVGAAEAETAGTRPRAAVVASVAPAAQSLVVSFIR